jgi:hypothetical protein
MTDLHNTDIYFTYRSARSVRVNYTVVPVFCGVNFKILLNVYSGFGILHSV